MKAQNILLPVVCILSVALMLSSCKKEEPQSLVNYDLLAEEITLSDQVYSDIFRAVSNESGNVQSGEGGSKAASDCGFITISGYNNDWPTVLSVDYGSGCTDDHGIIRKGKLTIAYNGPYFTAGSSLVVTTDNYYVNGYTVDGSLAIVNGGMNSRSNYEFSATVQQGRITKPDGSVVTLTSTRTFEWTDGDYELGIIGWCDNAWLISGFSEGTTSDGHDYRIEITTPIRKKSCCPWVVEGIISVTVDGTQEASIIYGNGECDHFATYIHGGITHQIILIK